MRCLRPGQTTKGSRILGGGANIDGDDKWVGGNAGSVKKHLKRNQQIVEKCIPGKESMEKRDRKGSKLVQHHSCAKLVRILNNSLCDLERYKQLVNKYRNIFLNQSKSTPHLGLNKWY